MTLRGILLLCSLALLCPLSAAADREASREIVIAAGAAGGNYDFLARRLRAMIVVEHRRFAEVVGSRGSLENLARLDDPTDPVNLGFAQADALARYLEDHPQFADELRVVGDVGRECIFLVAAKDGPIAQSADLKKPDGRRVSIDSPDSGAAATYEYLRRRDPGLRNTEPVAVDIMEALLQLKLGGVDPKLASAMWVQSPLQISPPLEVVLESPDTYRLVPFRADDGVGGALPDGSPVYTRDTVTLRHRGRVTTVDTLCTRGLLIVARPKLAESTRDELLALLLKSTNALAPVSD